MPEVEEAFAGMEVDAPRVGIIMGSASDKPTMEPAGKELHERGIAFEVRVLSAHRDPQAVADYARNAHMRGPAGDHRRRRGCRPRCRASWPPTPTSR